jgi:glycosyltransferase involved in cell wall biosynthesis
MEHSPSTLQTHYRSSERAAMTAPRSGDLPSTESGRASATTGSTAPTVLMLGPDRGAVSGISTHVNLLFGSGLANDFRLLHFQVGSEGRHENLIQRGLRLLGMPFAMWRTLRDTRPDVVHVNSAMDAKAYWRDLSLILVARLAATKIVLQIHGGFPPSEFLPCGALGRRFLRWSLGLPDAIVLLAESERQAYREFAPQLPTRVIPNAIELCSDTGPAHAKPDDHGPLRLVYIGRLERTKGVFETVSALGALRARGVPATLCLAGSGSQTEALASHVRRLGLGDQVEFRGPVFGAAKQALWHESDVFVFPTYREGLPYALLEAMFARSVVVTSPVGAIPDVIAEGRQGLFVQPGDASAIADAVEWIHLHRAEARRLGDAAHRRVVEHYGVARLADDFRTLYRQI